MIISIYWSNRQRLTFFFSQLTRAGQCHLKVAQYRCFGRGERTASPSKPTSDSSWQVHSGHHHSTLLAPLLNCCSIIIIHNVITVGPWLHPLRPPLAKDLGRLGLISVDSFILMVAATITTHWQCCELWSNFVHGYLTNYPCTQSLDSERTNPQQRSVPLDLAFPDFSHH